MSYADPTVKAVSPYEQRLAERAARRDPTHIPLRLDPRVQRMSGIAAHGDTPFDVPFMSQIDGNLWQGGCANGLPLPSEIEHLVSLYPWESYAIHHEMRSVLIVRMLDSEDQGFAQVFKIAEWVNACAEDAPTLVHCQAGLNRSSLVVAAALVLRGASGKEAIEIIREARSPACLCNPAFEAWLSEL